MTPALDATPKEFSIVGNLVDVHQRKIYAAEIHVAIGHITSITALLDGADGNSGNHTLPYILPGFIDAHVHIESSMLVPSEFARLAVVHGTVATVSDPHEIANVCGLAGVEFMIENGNRVPFKFYFGAPSCVPATTFETSGAELGAADVDTLLQRKEIKYLSEMMNFPGVLNRDVEVIKKIASAKKWNKPVDGHAPGLRGEAMKTYVNAGISTDHECFSREEALEKLQAGMKILIREGSAAKNFDALVHLLHDHADSMMFCSDDKHPDSLVEGHINQLCARAVSEGVDVFNVLTAACINPVKHYRLETGLLREGDPADFILVSDLRQFGILKTYIDGKLVAENGKTMIRCETAGIINQFNCRLKQPSDFVVEWNGTSSIDVIGALDGQLITEKRRHQPKIRGNEIISDPDEDILKIVVVNRYAEAPVAKAFITNFGLRKGAIASSVAHDSHNIVAVGVDDDDICRAVNAVIRHGGGISCVSDTEEVLPLPVAGLMSTEDGYQIANTYAALDQAAKSLGSQLGSPFMTLSFMALLVIPHVKLSDKGLFDGDSFTLMSSDSVTVSA